MSSPYLFFGQLPLASEFAIALGLVAAQVLGRLLCLVRRALLLHRS